MARKSEDDAAGRVGELRARLDEAEELLRSIRSGEVDALVVSGPGGDKVYTLSGAERPYRVMVEAMNEGAVILSGDSTIAYSNQSFASLLGMPLDEVIGSSMHRFVLAEDRPRYDMLQHQGADGTGRGEIHLTARSGAIVPVYLSMSSFESGTPRSTCAVVTNLTEQKRHQELVSAEALERTKREEAEAGQRRIKSILDSITDSFFSLDRTWRITDVNQRAATLFGKSREELIGTVFWALARPSLAPGLASRFHDAMERRVPVHHEGPSLITEGRSFEKHIYPNDEGLAVYFRDISDRKQIEERTAYQAKLLAHVHDAIVATDHRFVLTAWNAAAEELYGWKAEEALGRRVHDVIRSDVSESRRSEVLEELARVGHSYAEVAQFTRDGRRIWVEDHTSVLRDDSGAITGYVTAIRDITERKRAEDELRRSEANLAEAQKISHTGSWTWNVRTGECVWSLEHYRIFGLDPKTAPLNKDNTQRLIHPEDLPLVEQTLEKAIRERGYFDMYYRLVHPDGSIRYHQGVGHPVVDESGDLVFVGSVVDLTESRRIEDKLRRSEAYLAEGQRLSHVGSWALSASTNELFWSREHFRICGVDPDTFDVTLDAARQLIHPDDRLAATEVFTAAIEERRVFDDQFRFLRPDGTIRHVHSFGRPVFNDAGALIEYVGTVLDITERKEEELARQDLRRRLTVAQEDERRRIAHEMHDQFGQQLSALTLKLSALKGECGSRTTLSDALASLEAIARQLDHDLELIIWRLRPSALDDLGLIAALTNYVERWSKHFNVHAEVHVGAGGRERLTDEIETALYRITQEALNNVAKHARAAHVAVLLDVTQQRVSVIVEDDGVGFDPEERAGSREPFGIIGMRERAALLDGTVDIESEPGRGTTVAARIPLPSSRSRTRHG